MLNVKFVNVENRSETIELNYPGYGVDNGDKGPGKAISYAFKYALLKTFCLETGDDPDNDATIESKSADEILVTPKQCDFLRKMLANYPETKEKVEQWLQDSHGISSYDQITQGLFKTIIQRVEANQKGGK